MQRFSNDINGFQMNIGFLLGVSLLRLFWKLFSKVILRDFLVMIANFDSGILHILLQCIFWYGRYWFGAGNSIDPKENLVTLLLACKP